MRVKFFNDTNVSSMFFNSQVVDNSFADFDMKVSKRFKLVNKLEGWAFVLIVIKQMKSL